MALSPVDHFLMANSQREHESFLRDLSLEESGLRQQLANKTAAHEAYRTLMNEVIAAYEAGDNGKVHLLLTDRDARNAVYQPVYNEVYQRRLMK